MSHLPGPGQNKAADEEVAELSLHVILGPAFVPFVLMLMPRSSPHIHKQKYVLMINLSISDALFGKAKYYCSMRLERRVSEWSCELWDVLKVESLWRVVTGYLPPTQISRQAYKFSPDY